MKTIKPLGQISKLTSGFAFPPELQGRRSGSYPFAKVGDVSTVARAGATHISGAANYVDESDLPRLHATPVPPGAIVFAKIGEAISQNFRVLTAVPMLIDNNVMAIVADDAQVDSGYLLHYLRTVDFYPLAGKTTVPAIRKSVLESLPIPVPPLAEQRRIAALLDQADAIRRKRREAIALAESFLRSAFLEMFGDPVGNPLGWEVVRLASTFAEGPQLGTVVPVEETGTVPVVRVGQLGARELNWAAMGKVNLGASELGRFRLNEGDVLLARAIGSLDHLGKASVVGNLASTAVFDSHVMRLRLDHSVMLPQFFHTFLLTPGGRTRFLARASRTAVQFNISGTNIAEMLLPLPPMRLQRQFVDLAEAHALVVQKLEQAQREAERMFEGLVAGVLERQFSMRLPTPQVALPIGPDARRRALTRVT